MGEGAPVYDEYESEKYGVPQIDNVDLETELICSVTSRAAKVCIANLLYSKLYTLREAEKSAEEV